MHILTRFSLRRVSIVILLMAIVVLGGVYSAGQLKSELLPNIDLPVVSVVAVYPGAAPDDVRRDVTEPIEKVIAGTNNLKTLRSTSNDSVAFISAEYEYGTDMEKTQQTIQEGINRLTLPDQVQRPTVGRFNFQDIPVIAYTVNTNDTSQDALANLRRQVEDKWVPDLKAVNGVNSVVVAGGGTKQVQITFDNSKLTEKGLTASTVTNLLQANNISIPTGQITDNSQTIPVRVVNQFESLDDLRNLVVRPAMPATPQSGAATGAGQQQAGAVQGQGFGSTPGQSAGSQGQASAPAQAQSQAQGTAGTPGQQSSSGTPQMLPAVKLSDVATVDLVDAGGGSISRSNGKPSLSLIVYKTQNSNTVQVADDVHAHIDVLEHSLPGTQTVVLFDQSTFIKDSLDGLIREGILGAVLAIAVILLFLTSVRSTLVTAMSIPLSVLIAFVLLNVFSISLNIMSLAGLAVAIGRVVDDSIVVLENIYRHHFQKGEPLREAAFNGTKEVATAITASTITTVCVFLPLGFIAGLVSEFFRPFAVAVSVALLASLFVALTVIPVLAVLLLKTGRARNPEQAHAKAERDTFVQRLYTPTITWALSKRWTKLAVLGIALVLFVASMAIIPFIGTTFINVGSDKVLNVTLKMAPGTDLTTTSNAAASIESDIQKHPNVLNYQTTVGTNSAAASAGYGSLGSSSTAQMTVTLDKSVDLRAQADWLRGVIASESKTLGISDYNVTTGSGTGFNSSNFSVVVSGNNYNDVVKTGDALLARLKNVKDLVNVTSDAASAKPEIRVKVDPAKALAHGSTTVQIASQVRGFLTSQKATEITIGGVTYDVQATFDPNTLNSINDIKSIKVGTVNPVPLSDVADVSLTDGPVSITRVNQETAITLSGTINSDSTSGVTADAQRAINEVTPAAATKVALAGVTQQQNEAFGQLYVALAVAVILVYMIMVLTFGSLLTPFIIMFSLPLAAIGSIFALFITSRPLGVSALIGVLMLVGIVVTNAIVLLDLVEQYRARGLSTRDALVQGGRTRVRPILMTAIATIIALIPLVLGFSEGSIIASELGTVVVGGLFTSTFLTLIVVPVAYSLLDGLRNRLGGNRDGETEQDGVERNGAGHGLSELEETAPVQPAGAR